MRQLTLKQILGRGSMGTTYAAEFDGPEGLRVCAVKVMKSAGADRNAFRSRLREQGHWLRGADIRTVIGVDEVVVLDAHDAVITSLILGIDLGSIVKGGALPPRACAEFGAALADLLARLHRARPALAHRDLKPTNVMVTGNGEVWLLDFGIARAAYADREDKTQGLVLGTLNYFPPEILSGGEPDRRVDLYGLGVLALEVTSGQEWGPPLVHRERFDRRVEERLSALPEDRQVIGEILRGLLQWEPGARSEGVVVRDALRATATTLPGPGLAEWAAHAVDAMRDVAVGLRRDDLVGRTFKVASKNRATADQPTVALVAGPASHREGRTKTALIVGLVVAGSVAVASLVVVSLLAIATAAYVLLG
jgi:serine/threonine protein kinase